MQNKKTIPVYLVLVLVFLGIGFVFIPQFGDLTAAKTNVSKKVISHYEAQLLKLDVTTTNNIKIKKDDLKKGLVIINFWASWCLPCLEEFPSLVNLHNKFKDKDLLIIGINSDEDEIDKNIKKTVKKYSIEFPIVKDVETKITDEFMISAIPVSIIYFNGKVIEVSNGKKDFFSAEFVDKVEKLIKK